MKRAARYALFLGAAVASAPAQIVLNYNFTTFNEVPHLSIPDANATGVSDLREIADTVGQILKVVLSLEAEGDFNGDLYLTLQHNSGFAVILNRPGRTSENSFGYDDKGFNATFHDDAPNGDVHTYREIVALGDVPLSGSWQPDGRPADPALSLATSPRTAFLNSFQGQSVAGEWALFAADLSAGGETRILSWGLQITVVPEPRETALFTAARFPV